MLAVITLFIVITLSLIISRVATIALIHTGLPRESARFQARSALTGAGFTTTESESVVNHPVRRRIILILMLIGNAGIVTAISTLILTFVNRGDDTSMVMRIVFLIVGTSILLYLSQSKIVDKRLSILIDKFLKKYSSLKVQDYASLMRLTKDYSLAELAVMEQDWISEQTLKKAQLSQEGLLVLGVKKLSGQYNGAPRGSTKIEAGDILIIYGRLDDIRNIDIRRKTKTGDKAHLKAMKKQAKILEEE